MNFSSFTYFLVISMAVIAADLEMSSVNSNPVYYAGNIGIEQLF
jgi:hypothetical protein